MRERDEERRAAAERALRQQVQRVEQLIERAQKRERRRGSHAARGRPARARSARRRSTRRPAVDEREQQALVERLKAAAAVVVTPKLHELREMDEWKRFANAAVQEELIAQAEALRAKYGFDTPEGPKDEDLDKAARELHDIQERWKSVGRGAARPGAGAVASLPPGRGPGPGQGCASSSRTAPRSARATSSKKLALIERAEPLADSTDWIKTADELKKLQAEWQQIGPVPRQDTRVTWKRFRDACDAFFTRRNADLAAAQGNLVGQPRQEGSALRPRRGAGGVARLGARRPREIRRLQADWKNIGPVRRNKSEAVWQRFRTACDTFFDRYKRRDEIELESKQADREALVAELEALAAARAARQTARTAPGCSSRCARCAAAGTSRRRSCATAPIR